MDKRKKAATTTTYSSNCESKGNHSSQIIRQARSIFLSGRKVTAVELNEEIGFNDARKVISTLRNNEGWNIQDFRLDDGRKLYWLKSDDRQLSLFGTKGGIE